MNISLHEQKYLFREEDIFYTVEVEDKDGILPWRKFFNKYNDLISKKDFHIYVKNFNGIYGESSVLVWFDDKKMD